MRILVADDDRELSQLICKILMGAGHRPIPVFDGASAMMAAMRVPQPDLILLDMRMPAGDGQTTLTKLKAAAKSAAIPVMVLTAVPESEIRGTVTALGAEAFLQKPFEPEQLLAAVDALQPPPAKR